MIGSDRLSDGTAKGTSPFVVLDFLEVIYLDSTALEVVRAYQKAAALSGSTLVVYGLGGHPRSLLSRTGFDREIGLQHVVDTRRQALDLVFAQGTHPHAT